ncbi:MAG TPA: winged helix DNA-binding domain-containing protein [Actinomycetes bacterium]|nr:winged helix DNA-binding domain-containing protein [Actinomycetes bacterium]
MGERVLSTRELNRALLARQLLLDRSPLPLVAALEQVAGLQTQYAPSGYIALWSRLRGFRRADLTAALEERRAVQGTLMRSTIHVVSAGDHPLFAAGIRESRRAWWRRVQRHRLEGVDMDAVAALLRGHLAGGPRRQAELVSLLEAEGLPRMAWSGAGVWVDLVRVPPSGTWERRRADLYGLADDWLGEPEATEPQGLEHLARRYLGGFGPAPAADLANWAGLTVGALRPALDRLDLRRFRDERGTELLDLPDAPLPDAGTPAPARFLPTWDATLLVHARRTQILPERFRNLVFDVKTPHSVPTFLVDGAVAGTWRHEQGRIRLEPFEPIPGRARRELDAEAERLAGFHAP